MEEWENSDQKHQEEGTVIIKVQMKTSYLFDFLFWHSYHGIYGIVNFGFSILAIVLLINGFSKGNMVGTAALILLALLFTVINPLLLYRKAAMQIKRTPMFQKPLYYTLSEKEFSVQQDGETASTEWNQVLMLRETRKNIILYLGASNAIVLPKADYEDKLADVKELLHIAIPDVARKLKK